MVKAAKNTEYAMTLYFDGRTESPSDASFYRAQIIFQNVTIVK